jgi:hypothetical protein
MSKIRIQLLAAAAAIAATTLTGGTTAWASTAAGPHIQAQGTIRPNTTIEGKGFGTGATAAKAQHAAQVDLISNYGGCQLPVTVVYDTEDAPGAWSAEVTATCAHTN